MMFRSFAVLSLILTATSATEAKTRNILSSSSSLGQHLLANAVPADGSRRLDQNNNNNYNFLADYSIKFQGCHHVQQWNDNADDENDVRIMTKRLARFRLCPTDSCSNERSVGCSSKFGDYIVDMDTFVEAYLESLKEGGDYFCGKVADDCNAMCGGGNDDYDCQASCYEGYNAEWCQIYNGKNNNNNNNGGANFDAEEYAECKEIDLNGNGNNRRLEENGNNNNGNIQYYAGAYCADQGGEIRLGVFTDDTCTSFASNGKNLFKSTFGYSLPYSSHSLVSTRCFECTQYDEDQDNNDNNRQVELQQVCKNVYAMSGKCETRMNIDYPNESSCNYIDGVKIIQKDGVMRTFTTRKSKAAAVAIGFFLTLAVLLAGYVFYLRTKLSRAQINLAAASQSLT